jgi:hypothetical protein
LGDLFDRVAPQIREMRRRSQVTSYRTSRGPTGRSSEQIENDLVCGVNRGCLARGAKSYPGGPIVSKDARKLGHFLPSKNARIRQLIKSDTVTRLSSWRV